MSLLRIKDSQNVLSDLSSLLEHIHEKGAENPKTLEVLSFYKEFHPDEFSLYEEKILSALGLFYKINNPDNLYSFLMSQFGYEQQKASVMRLLSFHLEL